MSPAGLRLRRATPRDLDTVHALLAELALYERVQHRNRATRASLRRAMFGRGAALEGLIAERGGRAVGMALFQVGYSTFGATPGMWLEDLIVRPDARAGGVGGALMARLARIVRARRWGYMAWNVLVWNRPAIGFYRRLGARRSTGWIGMQLAGAALTRLGRAPRSAAGTKRTARRR